MKGGNVVVWESRCWVLLQKPAGATANEGVAGVENRGATLVQNDCGKAVNDAVGGGGAIHGSASW